MPDMRFLIDAQLPPALARFIESQGLESRAVREVGLREAEDEVIWTFAASEQWVVITKDEDFVERVLARQSGPQIVWLRLGNCTNRVLLALLQPIFADVLRELETGSRIVEVRLKDRQAIDQL